MDDLISRQWLMECVDEGWIKFDTGKDKNQYIHLVRDIAPSAQLAQDLPNGCTDTISRQAAIDALAEWHDEAVTNRLNNLPSAQQERKKGKWLPDNNNYYEERFICSVCGKSYKVDTCIGKPILDFCPNCGARLDGKDGDRHDSN